LEEHTFRKLLFYPLNYRTKNICGCKDKAFSRFNKGERIFYREVKEIQSTQDFIKVST